MAIEFVDPTSADLTTVGANGDAGFVQHSDVQAGDLVLLQFSFKRNMSGIAANPLTITSGSDPQDPNSNFWEFRSGQTSWFGNFGSSLTANNARSIALFWFIATADDITGSGVLTVEYDWANRWRHNASISVWRGVDTGSPFTTVTTDTNMHLTSDLDTGRDQAIEFTAPLDPPDEPDFWNSTFLPGDFTIVALGAFGRSDFDADPAPGDWTEGLHRAGATENDFVYNQQNTLLAMYRKETSFDADLMDGISVSTTNNLQRSASMWIVLKEASTTTAHTFSATDSATASDSLDIIHGDAHTFSETDSATASDSLTATETGTSHTFSETDTSTASDLLTVVEVGTSHTFSQTDSATSVDSLTTVETGTNHTFSETDLTTTEDSLARLHGRLFTETDSSTTSDSLTVIETGTSHTFSESDSASTIDVLTATETGAAYTFSETDSSSASDSVTVVETGTAHVFSETDSVSASDLLTATEAGAANSFSETDSTSTLDTLLTQVTRTVNFTDSTTVSDEITAVSTGSRIFVGTDSSTASDELTTLLSHVFSQTDSSTVSDVLTAIEVGTAHTFTATDSTTVSDQLSTFVASVFSAIDSVSASDISIVGKGQLVSFTDSVTGEDDLTKLRSIAISLLDAVSSSDQVIIVNDVILLFTDSSSASDTLTVVVPEVIELEIVIGGTGTVIAELLTEAQVTAILNVWNTALNTLGISTLTTTVGDNPQQTLLSNVFTLFRQQFLSDNLWNGAKKTAKLTQLTTTATDNPALDRWDYAWDLPSDALRVWRLNGLENRPNHVGGNPNIATNRWEIEIITVSAVNYRALLTNQSEATIEYMADIGDAGVDLLGPATQHAMGMALAVYVATNFGKSASEIAQLDGMAKEAITAAKGIDGQEGTPQIFGNTSLLGVRYLGS